MPHRQVTQPAAHESRYNDRLDDVAWLARILQFVNRAVYQWYGMVDVTIEGIMRGYNEDI